ncbi:MAG: cupin domain-containing protein [Salinirussus sp.]
MQPIDFGSARSYEPDAGWRRLEMAGSDRVSLEFFEKPAGHTSPMHHHENEQVCVVLEGTVIFENEAGEEHELGPLDSLLLESDEPHSATNPGDEMATGIDIFAPGRGFEYWTEE